MRRVLWWLFVVVLAVVMLYAGMWSAEYTVVHKETLREFLMGYVAMQRAFEACIAGGV